MARVDSGVGVAPEEDILRLVLPRSITTAPNFAALLGGTLTRSRRNLADIDLALSTVEGSPTIAASHASLSSTGYLTAPIAEGAAQMLAIVAKTDLDGSSAGTRPNYASWTGGASIFVGSSSIVRASAQFSGGAATASAGSLANLSNWRMFIMQVTALKVSIWNMTDAPNTENQAAGSGSRVTGASPLRLSAGAAAQFAFVASIAGALDVDQRLDLYNFAKARLAARSTPIAI